MKVAIDTSVLVAGVIASHVHYGRAAVWLQALASGLHAGVATAHALNETYSVLTKIPCTPRIDPATGERLVSRLRGLLHVVAVSDVLAAIAIERCARLGLTSGAVFDALHLVTAEAEQVDVVVTFNVRHFARLAIASSPRIVAPPDPPAIAV
jgi:predicted nucleic acid-binding protein